MKKITLLMAAMAVLSVANAQLTTTPLWEFSVLKANLTTSYVDDTKNGFDISPDGTNLYLSTRAADANQVTIYNTTTGVREGYLPGLAGFASNYAGDVAVDDNGAIYACNVIISGTGALKIAKWESKTATPTLFISTTTHGGDATKRIGYGMDVRINSEGNGFIIMHANTTATFSYWTITKNAPTSQDPISITATGATAALIGSYSRISIVNDNTFWLDGNLGLPFLCTITKMAADIDATPTAISGVQIATRTDVNPGVSGTTEFSLLGSRYMVIGANNHSTAFAGAGGKGHFALVQKMDATGVGVTGSVVETIPVLGLGLTTDASHFVKSVVYVSGTSAYIYTMGGFNGIAAYKITDISTGMNSASEETTHIIRTSKGIEVLLQGEAAIELYSINGVLIDRAKVTGTYSHDLNNGVYLIRVNGKATKFIK